MAACFFLPWQGFWCGGSKAKGGHMPNGGFVWICLDFCGRYCTPNQRNYTTIWPYRECSAVPCSPHKGWGWHLHTFHAVSVKWVCRAATSPLALRLCIMRGTRHQNHWKHKRSVNLSYGLVIVLYPKKGINYIQLSAMVCLPTWTVLNSIEQWPMPRGYIQ